MRVCVVGAGAIGGLLGARLSLAGEDVSVLARGESLGAIAARGFTLIEPDGVTRHARDLRVVGDLGTLPRQDLVVLAVKSHQLREVAASVPLLFHDTTAVVPLQNGIPWWFFQHFSGPYEGTRLDSLDPDGALERLLPSDRLVGSIAYPAVTREAPGVVRLVEGDRFPVGELDGSRSARVVGLAQLLTAAGFTSRVLTDIRSHLWIKAWGNLSFNPISALTGATLGQICGFAPTRDLATRIMGEASDVADRLGLRLRISIEQRIEGAAAVGEHKTSMLQDAEAGRALEIDALIGAFVELGRLTATAMPATETLLSLVSLLDARRLDALLARGPWRP